MFLGHSDLLRSQYRTLADGGRIGTTVMSYIGTQRRHDLVGPTADTFVPFRWNDWTPKTWEFLPFKHGPVILGGCRWNT